MTAGDIMEYDLDNNPVVLFANEWAVGYFAELNPKVELDKLPLERVATPVSQPD